ncbi:unnamed protein product [Durusdinium trenchii]|uniref:PDZ domain-containing protein n=2 Tax=Durusdinium trenchii TaxID=1381693 RepID=A0ABP0PXH1_9DINO
MRVGRAWRVLLLPLGLVFVGPMRRAELAEPRVARQSLAGGAGLEKARFMGRWVDWKPVLSVASLAEETGGEMPLGIRFTLTDDGHFEISEIISGGSASNGALEVEVGNIIHAVSCEVDGQKDVAIASQMTTVDQMTQAILSNSDEIVMMLVEKPDPGAAGSISFLTNVATKF